MSAWVRVPTRRPVEVAECYGTGRPDLLSVALGFDSSVERFVPAFCVYPPDEDSDEAKKAGQ